MTKRYSAQFKQEALNFVQTHPSLAVATVAKQLGVGYSTLDNWLRQHRQSSGQVAASAQSAEQQSKSVKYTFMQQHICTYRMSALCEALHVSHSGFHAWRVRPVNQAKLQLNRAVKHCHSIHKACVGAPSMQSCKLQVGGMKAWVQLAA